MDFILWLLLLYEIIHNLILSIDLHDNTLIFSNPTFGGWQASLNIHALVTQFIAHLSQLIVHHGLPFYTVQPQLQLLLNIVPTNTYSNATTFLQLHFSCATQPTLDHSCVHPCPRDDEGIVRYGLGSGPTRAGFRHVCRCSRFSVLLFPLPFHIFLFTGKIDLFRSPSFPRLFMKHPQFYALPANAVQIHCLCTHTSYIVPRTPLRIMVEHINKFVGQYKQRLRQMQKVPKFNGRGLLCPHLRKQVRTRAHIIIFG